MNTTFEITDEAIIQYFIKKHNLVVREQRTMSNDWNITHRDLVLGQQVEQDELYEHLMEKPSGTGVMIAVIPPGSSEIEHEYGVIKRLIAGAKRGDVNFVEDRKNTLRKQGYSDEILTTIQPANRANFLKTLIAIIEDEINSTPHLVDNNRRYSLREAQRELDAIS